MALSALLALSCLAALRAFASWRKGLALMIILAAIQDPLRKLVPGTPGWLVLVTAPVFLATVGGSISRSRHWFGEFRRHFPSTSKSLLLLVVLCLPAALISATYGTGSWQLTLLGIFSYSVMFLAIITGYHYARSVKDVRKLLAVYCLAHGLTLVGAYLEFLKVAPGARVLGSAALGYEWIRWGSGYTVDMLCGFYRSADVMGWHAASVSMLSLVLAFSGKSPKRRVWLLVSAFAIGALLLCGRRKMVFMLPIFVAALLWIYWQAGRQARVAAITGMLLIPVLGAWLLGDVVSNNTSNIRYYSGEGMRETVLGRVEEHGFGSLVTTFEQSGFFGEGLGFATPGLHNLNAERPRVWQESTSSRILVELGVPGALGFLAVMVGILLNLWRQTMQLLRAKSPKGAYAAGLFAFFLANVGSLTVSGQILADPFIAAFLGMLVGLLLSLPWVSEGKAPSGKKSSHQGLPPTVPSYGPVAG